MWFGRRKFDRADDIEPGVAVVIITPLGRAVVPLV